MKKSILNIFIIAIVTLFSLSGCAEHRYYQENHRHSDRYQQHRMHRDRDDRNMDRDR